MTAPGLDRPARRALDWRPESVVALAVAAYSVVIGAVVGLLWPVFAPQINGFRATFLGSEDAYKALLGDDLWLAFLGALAGLVCVLLTFAMGRIASGPGAVVGLAAGGALGSLVAEHVGHQRHNPAVIEALRHAVVSNGLHPLTAHNVATLSPYVEFTVRANAALLAWPVVAVVVLLIVTALRRETTAPPVAIYAGRP
ncbi:MAG TPA: hypothetical protein VG708_08645 [Mycobacteriales bacterium]|jgi:hypothetical protein|nr:hypothetical protein [Mycobacteriales bacterium]